MIDYVEVMLVRGRGLSSAAIGYFGAGYWSHYANVVPRGAPVRFANGKRTHVAFAGDWVLDARYDHVGGEPPGVRYRPSNYLAGEERIILRIHCLPEQARAWLAAGDSQLGKPYDARSIWAFVTGRNASRNWRNPSAWFCDELGIWMLEQSGRLPRLPLHINRVTPGTAYAVCGALGGTVVAHLPALIPLRPARALP